MVNFNPIDKDYIVNWQSDLENTKESILPVCDKPYHKIKENMPLGEEHENLWNYPFNIQYNIFISTNDDDMQCILCTHNMKNN